MKKLRICCWQKRRKTVQERVLWTQMVSYRQMGELFVARARHVIILSVGPYGSPQTLQILGVGPADVLRRGNAPLAHLLPVGVDGKRRATFLIVLGYTALLLEVNDASWYDYPNARPLFEQGLGWQYAFQLASVNGRIQGAAELTALSGFGIQPMQNQLVIEPMLVSCCATNPTRGMRTRFWIAKSDASRPPRARLGVLQSRADQRQAAKCFVRMLSVG